MDEFMHILWSIQEEMDKAMLPIANNLFNLLNRSADSEGFWQGTSMKPLTDGSGFIFSMTFTVNERNVVAEDDVPF